MSDYTGLGGATGGNGGNGISIGQEDVQKRTKEFIDAYGELVKKYKIDFASYPAFQPDGNGGFRVVIQSVPLDVTARPEPSPFIAQ